MRVLGLLTTLLLLLMPSAAALAHSPIFPEGNHSLATAYKLDDASKSWAIYTALTQPGVADYYSFSRSKGEKIELSLITPSNPATSRLLPSVAILIPGQNQHVPLPVTIDMPTGYGHMLINGSAPETATYEPFAPGWYYELSHLEMDAPVDGLYYVVVFDSDNQVGNYGLPLGYLESFTPLEIILVPYHLQMVYLWEGQSGFIILLPFVGTIAAGGLLLYWRAEKGKGPSGWAKWLAAIGGVAFLGGAANIAYQMGLALCITGFQTEAFATVGFLMVGVILGALTLWLTLRSNRPLTLWRRAALIVIAVSGLLFWAGLYLGPVLVLISAIIKDSSHGQANQER
jgi:hypothetical protein